MIGKYRLGETLEGGRNGRKTEREEKRWKYGKSVTG